MIRLIRTSGGWHNGDSIGYSCGILHCGKEPKERAPRKPIKKRKKGQKTKGKMIPLRNLK